MKTWAQRLDEWLTRAYDLPWEYPLSTEEARDRMPSILRGLASDNEEIRLQSGVLAEFMGPQAIEAEPLLFAMVDDDDPKCKQGALGALMAIRPDSADRVRFVGRYLNDPSVEVASSLDLHATDLRPILNDIVQSIRHADAFARSWAAALLARPELRGPKTLPWLRRLMADEHHMVRVHAAKYFVDAGGPPREAAAIHAQLLDDPTPLARHFAAYDLGRLGRDADEFLHRLQLLALFDEEEFVRRMAADVVMAVRGDPDAPPLDPTKYSRPYAEECIRRMRGPDFIQDDES